MASVNNPTNSVKHQFYKDDGNHYTGNGPALSPHGQAALAYLEAGLSPVPLCWPNDKGECGYGGGESHTKPHKIGKAPIVGTGYEDKRLTEAQVKLWWQRYPLANIGILLEPAGFLVIDSDSPEADREVESRGVPPGPRVTTPHGIHRYFHANGSAGRTTKQGESRAIDVLSKGFVVVPPSRTPVGVYRWEIGLTDIELDEPPAWAVELLTQAKKKAEPITLDGDLVPVELTTLGLDAWLIEVITTGQTSYPEKYPSRSEAVFAAITGLLHAGCSVETIASILLDPRYVISAKPREQGQRWLLGDIARAQGKQQAEHEGMNGSTPPPDVDWGDEATFDIPPPDQFPCTDLGNG